MKVFTPSEQAAIQQAGGNNRAENTARWVEKNSPPPLPIADEIKEAIKNVGLSTGTGTKIGGALAGAPGESAGTLIGAGVGILPTLFRASGPAAGSISQVISNRNIRNAEREIRNGVKPGANRSEARRALVKAVLQNQGIQAGE